MNRKNNDIVLLMSITKQGHYFEYSSFTWTDGDDLIYEYNMT